MKLLVIDSQKASTLLLKRKLLQNFKNNVEFVSGAVDIPSFTNLNEFDAIIISSHLYSDTLKSTIAELKSRGYMGIIILSVIGVERKITPLDINIQVVDKTINDEDFIKQILNILGDKESGAACTHQKLT